MALQAALRTLAGIRGPTIAAIFVAFSQLAASANLNYIDANDGFLQARVQTALVLPSKEPDKAFVNVPFLSTHLGVHAYEKGFTTPTNVDVHRASVDHVNQAQKP